ncbi:hypothetical protein MBM_01257 [Drepanopeziza brunnea f. sp. 'multigermtubi' MB_m1]|uniref:Polyprotein n=1 Tax=Marssonina brunnea f. sp. multigermtubi (strain MB_m1) TaxID=1072389 RepID=K1WSJ0_MARBU|nr:uncharacterized protein MBM_01257 [Drepanopeziza brunnea f. sp. 'multigermtubi' MB_m1]EKD20575.1 hypothetical protein MBM_01257 [Drepanopeziza brunnea f. sp. 'multigermtubi' MB_m1]
MADRATRPLNKESSRQRAVGYYTPRVLLLPTEPLTIQPKGPLYLRLLSLSKRLNDKISSISFNLNELLYARLDNKITARAIISVLNFSNSKRKSSIFERTDKLFRSFNKLRIDKKDTKGIRIVKSALKSTDIIKLKP